MEPMLGNTCNRLTPLVSSGGYPMLLRSPMPNLTSYCITIWFHRSPNIPGLDSRMDQSHSRLLSTGVTLLANTAGIVWVPNASSVTDANLRIVSYHHRVPLVTKYLRLDSRMDQSHSRLLSTVVTT
jgi:hypothetical protein